MGQLIGIPVAIMATSQKTIRLSWAAAIVPFMMQPVLEIGPESFHYASHALWMRTWIQS
jgi:hypothetical protein